MADIFRRIFPGDILPLTVEDIFRDFCGRRSGLLGAFTTDVERFYAQCDPKKDNMSLYGFSSGRWEVNIPPEILPPNLPQPTVGINFARDGMLREDWLGLVAAFSDSWLLSLSSYFSASAKLTRDERKRLFDMINDLPTLFEVMT